ncbi:MAG TPA: OmpA family protein [Polyangiaceae bacterium]|nr:OmpA family protein [Polyangiaceae bacterium]
MKRTRVLFPSFILKSIPLPNFRSTVALPFAIAVLVLGLSVARPAQAQRAFYLERVQVGGAPDDGLVTRRPYLGPETRIYGSATLAYVVNALRASTVAATPDVEEKIENLIKQQLMTYFSGGIEIGGRVSLGLSFPVAWAQSGGDVPIPGSRPPPPSIFPIDTGTALYDISLEGKVLLYNNDESKFRLGLGAALFIPAGTFARGGSDNSATFYVYGAVEKTFGPLLVAGTVGPHFRPLRGIDGSDSKLDLGNEFRINTAVFVDLAERLRVGGELNGMLGFAEDEDGNSTFMESQATPWEWLGSARVLFGSKMRTYARASVGTRFTNGYGAPDLRIMLSLGHWALIDDLVPEDTTRVRFAGDDDVGKPPPDTDKDADGFPDSIDACPEQPEDGQEPYPSDGCPANSDRDGDGIPDLKDKCPDDPEDVDRVQDEDGCPEKDGDGDGVLDVRDACPLVPGVEQGDPKRDGCTAPPKKLVIEADKGELRLLEPVQFETATAELKQVSYSLLDEVVNVMLEAPDIRLAVYGHTDNRGAPGYNRDLSQRRAQAVVKYLTDKGIAFERLEAKGFGADRPVATNDTDAGRAQNRRVEFKILPELPKR